MNIPFRDDSFDDVVCVDTLEHLDKSDRLPALHELLRVAKKRVIVSGPVGSFARRGDGAYAEHLARNDLGIPTWLAEHVDCGIPTLGDLLDALWRAGYTFTVFENEGIMQHYAGLFADNYPFMTAFLQDHERKFPAGAPLRAAPGDVPYSYQFTIDATIRRPALPCQASHDINGTPTIISTPRRPASLSMFSVECRPDRRLRHPDIQSILMGAIDLEDAENVEISRDDSGDSIADRRSTFGPMTALYWIWKNVKGLDAVGFFDHRRYFDFRESILQSARETTLRSQQQVKRHQTYFADRSVIDRRLGDGELIVARPEIFDLPTAEEYMRVHLSADYLVMVNYILAHHPHLAKNLVDQLSGRALYADNMFIMPWPQFERLCQFLFECLFGIEKLLCQTRRPRGEATLALLSEYLFDLHIRWLAECGQALAEYPIFVLREEASV